MNALRNLKRAFVRRAVQPAFNHTRSTRPVSDSYGYERGRPIDRYYIEKFFAGCATDIRGDVLEIQEGAYTRRFGRDLSSQNVLDIDPRNAHATVIADLTAADSIPSGSFDCFVLPQTLHFIYDVRSAVHHALRILRPGGVLLATVPAVSRVDPELFSSDFWRFTPASCERLFGEHLGPEGLTASSFGNALSCSAFITGMSAEEFSSSELDPVDSFFPLILAIRARKGS